MAPGGVNKEVVNKKYNPLPHKSGPLLGKGHRENRLYPYTAELVVWGDRREVQGVPARGTGCQLEALQLCRRLAGKKKKKKRSNRGAGNRGCQALPDS